MLERGIVSEAELRSGKSAGKSALQAIPAAQVAALLDKGAPTILPAESAPLFSEGARVRVRKAAPKSHTRAPRYTRGCEGVVVHHHGAHIFPDRHAACGEKQPAHLYSVRFQGEVLWGASKGEEPLAVYADLFEPYLVAADAEP